MSNLTIENVLALSAHQLVSLIEERVNKNCYASSSLNFGPYIYHWQTDENACRYNATALYKRGIATSVFIIDEKNREILLDKRINQDQLATLEIKGFIQEIEETGNKVKAFWTYPNINLAYVKSEYWKNLYHQIELQERGLEYFQA